MQHPSGLPGSIGVLLGLTLPTGLDCACCTQACQPPQSSQAPAGFPPPFDQKGRGVEGAGGAIGLPHQQRFVGWWMLGSAVYAAVRHSWEHFSTGIQPGIKELVQSTVAMCPLPHGCLPSSSCQAPAPFLPAMCQGYPALLAIEVVQGQQWRCWHCPPAWHLATPGLLFCNAQADSGSWALDRVEWCF